MRFYTKREIADRYPDISVTTIEKALSELLKAGYIKKIGSGRGTTYVKNSDYVESKYNNT